MVAAGLIMAGCQLNFLKNPCEKIYHQLEKSASEEKEFNQVQKPLVDAEGKEQTLYNQLVNVDKNNDKKTSQLSQQAIQSVEKRSRLIKKEKDSIDKAYQTFKKILPQISKIKDDEAKQEAERMANTMSTRYKNYQKLYNDYQSALTDDRKLYELFNDQKLKADTLQKQLEKVNSHYQTIDKDKDAFNKATKTFNQQKKIFYNVADIDKEE